MWDTSLAMAVAPRNDVLQGLLERALEDISPLERRAILEAGDILDYALVKRSREIVFNPQDTAEQLKKHSGFIPGYRPGERTAEYIDYVLTRITLIGAIYLVIVCLLPEFLISATGIPFYLGGTSLLIVVSVTLDTVAQVQGHLIAHQYEGLIKKSKLRGGKRGR